MQPYFLPYIGYFQLIGAVDLFIVYDDIKYTKKGWINRNRFLNAGKDNVFSLPLKGDSDFLDVRDRVIAAEFDPTRLLNKILGAYRRAPYFAETAPVIEAIVHCEERNLFRYVRQSIDGICKYLGIATEIRTSSDLAVDHHLKGKERVLATCETVQANVYINAIGGTELYARGEFQDRGIELLFLKPKEFEYAQFGHAFVPWLSIIDVMMFNPPDVIRERVASNFDLV